MNSGITSPSARASLRAAYVRSAGFGMAIGAGLGVGTAVVLGLVQGYRGDIPIFAILDACLGIAAAAVLAGAAALTLTITRPASRRGRTVAVTITVCAGAVALVAAALAFVPGVSLAAAIPAGIGAAAIGLSLSVAAERRALRHPAPGSDPDGLARRPLAATAVILGGVLALPLGSGLITLLRERLRYLCSAGVPGTEAEGWTCADGISYLGAGFLPLGVGALAVISGLTLILAHRDPRPVRAILVALAPVAIGAGLLGTWLAVSDPRETPPGVSRTDLWIDAVLPTVVVAALALVIAVVGVATRGRLAVVLTGVAAAGILTATVLQPGLALSTMPALGLLVASVLGIPASPSKEATRSLGPRGERHSA